jgi:hypothetical protein
VSFNIGLDRRPGGVYFLTYEHFLWCRLALGVLVLPGVRGESMVGRQLGVRVIVAMGYAAEFWLRGFAVGAVLTAWFLIVRVLLRCVSPKVPAVVSSPTRSTADTTPEDTA